MSALPVHALYPCVLSDGFWRGTPALVVRLIEHTETPPPPDDELPDDLPSSQFHAYDHDHAVTLNALLERRGGALRYSMPGPATLAAAVANCRGRHVVLSGREPGRHDIDPVVRALQDVGRAVQIETTGGAPINAPGAWVTLHVPPARTTRDLAPGLAERADEVLIAVRWRADFDRAEALFASRPQIWLRASAYAEPWVQARCVEVAARHNGWRVRPPTGRR